MTRNPHPDETADELRAALKRNHPELSDDQLDQILTGEPARRRKAVPLVENRGRSESRYEAPSSGRTTTRPSAARQDGPST